MKKITTVIVVLVVAILIAWDLIAFGSGGVDATISNVIKESAQKYLMIPYSGGVLISHFFWNGETFVPPRIRYYALATISVAALVFSFIYMIPTTAACVAGILIGRLLWPQPKKL